MAPQELARLQALPLNLRAVHCIAQIEAAWGEAQRGDHITPCASKKLERAIPEITVSMGAVRRIMGTPMPFAYLSHLRTFLLIWIGVLPFVFMYYMEWLAIVVCIVIAYSLLGMEAISLEIEAPFGRWVEFIPPWKDADKYEAYVRNRGRELSLRSSTAAAMHHTWHCMPTQPRTCAAFLLGLHCRCAHAGSG